MQNDLFIYDLRNFMMPDISSLCAFQLAVTYNNPLNVNEWTKIYIEHRTVCVSNLFHPGIGHNPSIRGHYIQLDTSIFGEAQRGTLSHR